MPTQLDLAWLDPSLAELRRPGDGLGTGLSRAVSDRLGIDVTLVRVGFVVLALCSGLGIALYLWGTLLSYGADGRRPVDTWGIAEWPPTGQRVFVVASTILLMVLTAAVTPLPWGAGAVFLLGFVLFRKNRRQFTSSEPGEGSMDLATLDQAEATDDVLVSRWRSTMSEASGSRPVPPPMPEDLEPHELHDPPHKPATTWLGGLAVVALAVAAGWASFALVGAGVLTSLVTGTATLGLAIVALSLTTRRRLPRLVLIAAGGLMALTGWLSVEAATPARQSTPTELHITSVDQWEGEVVTITPEQLEGVETLSVRAVGSTLTVVLPGIVTDVEVVDQMGVVMYGSRRPGEQLDLRVEAESILSYIDFEVSAP